MYINNILDLHYILNGFLAGLIATFVMTIIQIPIKRKLGLYAVLEWHENQSIMSYLTKKNVDEVVLSGLVLHFINGGLAGIAFSVLIWFLGISYWLPGMGIIYGILLWFFTLALIHERVTGLSLRKHPLGLTPSIISLVLHLVYGFMLGIWPIITVLVL